MESTACGRPVPASPGAQERTPRRAQDLRSWAALGQDGYLGSFTLWRASWSHRATLGGCLGTVGLRVGELHGQLPQRELSDHRRGQKQGLCSTPTVGSQRLDPRTLWAQNPSDMGTGSGIPCCC